MIVASARIGEFKFLWKMLGQCLIELGNIDKSGLIQYLPHCSRIFRAYFLNHRLEMMFWGACSRYQYVIGLFSTCDSQLNYAEKVTKWNMVCPANVCPSIETCRPFSCSDSS